MKQKDFKKYIKKWTRDSHKREKEIEGERDRKTGRMRELGMYKKEKN